MSAQVWAISCDGLPEIHQVSNSLGARHFFIGVLNGGDLNMERDLKCLLMKQHILRELERDQRFYSSGTGPSRLQEEEPLTHQEETLERNHKQVSGLGLELSA